MIKLSLFSFLSDVRAFLGVIDDLVAGNSSGLLELNELYSISNEQTRQATSVLLNDHAMAFDQGTIPCQRLIEFVLPPFLKLARKACQDMEPRDAAEAD